MVWLQDHFKKACVQIMCLNFDDKVKKIQNELLKKNIV